MLSKYIENVCPFATLDIMTIMYLHCSQHPENKTKQKYLLAHKKKTQAISFFFYV